MPRYITRPKKYIRFRKEKQIDHVCTYLAIFGSRSSEQLGATASSFEVGNSLATELGLATSRSPVPVPADCGGGSRCEITSAADAIETYEMRGDGGGDHSSRRKAGHMVAASAVPRGQ